jgi:hypothetical protein
VPCRKYDCFLPQTAMRGMKERYNDQYNEKREVQMKKVGFKNMPKRQANKFAKIKVPKDVPVPRKDEWWRKKTEA